MLEFYSQQINFSYQPKGHLKSEIVIHNSNQSIAYYKFKLTRPKYYQLKPDRGFIMPNQTINIDIKLHQEGVNDAESDKIKIFSISVGKTMKEPTQGWQSNSHQTQNKRLPININGLPGQFKHSNNKVRSSEVRSLANSKFSQVKSHQSTFEMNKIKQKQLKVQNLRKSINGFKQNNISKDNMNDILPYAIVGAIGLAIGILSAIWI